MNDYSGMLSPDYLRSVASGVENQNHAAEEQSRLYNEVLSWRRAALALMPHRPEDNPKDGPCCFELEDCGGGTMRWLATGCDCGNFDDAQEASNWAHSMNKFLDAEDTLKSEGLESFIKPPEID